MILLKYPWQTAHDYELAKLGYHFLYLEYTPMPWAVSQRPIPNNIEWISDIQKAKADVMILHLDQWSWHQTHKRFLFLNTI